MMIVMTHTANSNNNNNDNNVNNCKKKYLLAT